MSDTPTDLQPQLKARGLGAPATYGFALALVLLSTLLVLVWRDHEATIQAADRHVAAVALGSDRLLTLKMGNLERALKGISGLFETAPDAAGSLLQGTIAGVRERHAELLDIVLVDPAGRALSAGNGDPTIADWARQTDNRVDGDGLIVGPPARLGQAGPWVVPLAVPLSDKAGGPPGWVLARLRLSALREVVAGVDVGQHGVANIFHGNGVMLARSQDAARSVGQDFSQSELMRELLLRSRTGTDDRVSPLDGVRRILAFRALESYPLVVVVGVSRNEILGPWYALAGAASVVCVVYALGWLLVALALVKADVRQRALLAQLRQSSETLLEAQQIAGLGSWSLDLDTDQVEFSPEAQSLYGWVPGMAPLTLQSCLGQSHPDDREQLEAEHAKHVAENSFRETRYRIVRPDGGVRSVVARGRVVEVEGRRMQIGTVQDVTERMQHEHQLAYQASHDDLTGLLNRRALLAGLESLLAAAGGQAATTLLYIDINNFKLINDSLGHEVGDEVLRVTAQRLRASVGVADCIGRLGGNEFLVALNKGSGQARTDERVARILAALAQPIEVLSTLHYLSVSAGIARYPEHGRDTALLLKHAGLATHEAKRRGHNQLVEYTADFERAVIDRQHLISRLHEAMERGEFELFFQPLFSSTAQRPIGLEALIRWRHPERGLVPPSEFIPVCEDSGLIVPLGRWVLREACRYHHLLAAAGWSELTIAVNVSASQFLNGKLQHDIPALLREFDMPTGVLELELTESLVMENPESVIEVMRELRQYGVLLSIDDFGTGYSSMSYLHRLPVDKLKIDRSFITNVDSDSHNAAICESILALARSFDLKVIAEGVETQAQLEWLREHGCDEVQGYLLARPAPFADVVAGLGR